MPELAEVAYACNLWKKGLGKEIKEVFTHPTSRVYRDLSRSQFTKKLSGTTLTTSVTHGKQMLFSFSGNGWLGIHLGMTGNLFLESNKYEVQKHDALILKQREQTLVFRDPRQFGRLRLHIGTTPPDWWSNLPTGMLSNEFKRDILQRALTKHRRRPLKALLLDQRYFPGMGNWMADEVLWRAKIHPAALGAQVSKGQEGILYKQIILVANGAMKSVGQHGGDPPLDWLFHTRWKDGLLCPKTKVPLIREQIGGRTTCWSPALQKKI